MIELGVREDGKPWVMRLADSSGILIGGVPGSGKSGVLAALLAGLAGTPGVEIAGVDLKGGVELGPWAPCMLTLATTLEEAVPVLEEGVELLQHRYKVLWGQGARHIAELAPAPPLRVIVADEAADLFTPAPGSKTEKELTDRALRAALSIARRGRAGGVLLGLATQKPDSVAVPTALRDQLGHRIQLRVSTRQHAETILGGLVDLAEVTWQIPPHLPGVALVAGSEPEPFLARAYQVTTEDVRRIVEHANRGQSVNG